MAEEVKKERKGFDDVKSLIISGATLGPIAIGLGLGVRAGFNQIKGNQAFGDVFTGGRANELEMIGRAVGKTRAGMAKDALVAARAITTNNIQMSMDLFAAAATGESPQRNALYHAYISMLNSKSLNLSETEIANESKDLLGSIDSGNFESTIMDRIKKRETELGKGKSDEFIRQMTKFYQRSLEVEQGLKSSSPIQLLTRDPIVKLNNPNITGSLGKRVGHILGNNEATERFRTLQNMISGNGLSGKYTIYDASAMGGQGVFARVQLKGTPGFDVPLTAIRNKFMQKIGGKGSAAGGLVLLDGGKSMAMVGGAINMETGAAIGAEQRVLNLLAPALNELAGARSSEQRKAIVKRFHDRAYSSQQILTHGASAEELARASLETFQYEVPSEALLGDILTDPKFKGYTPVGVTPGGLVGKEGIAALYDVDTPAFGPARMGYHGSEDMSVSVRPQQWSRKSGIVRSNTPINLVNSMSWSDMSQVGVIRFANGDSREAYRIATSGTQISSPTIYQLPDIDPITKDKSFRFEKELNVIEGTSLGGRVFGSYTDTKTLTVMGKTPAGKQHPLLSYILERYNKDGAFSMTKNELGGFLKSKGIKGTNLGFDAKGLPVSLNILNKRSGGFRIGAIEEVSPGEYRISSQLALRPGEAMKMHSPTMKGLQIEDRYLKRHLRQNTNRGKWMMGYLASQNQGRKSAAKSIVITSSKQLLRSQQAINEQILTGTSMILESKGFGGINDFVERIERGGMGGTGLVLEAIKTMEKAGADPIEIASVVASHFRSDLKGGGEGALKGSGISTTLESAIRSTREVVGITTSAIDPHDLGIGKPTKLEKRSINAIISHIKTLGINMGMPSDEIRRNTTEILANVTGRGASRYESVLTNRSLEASLRTMGGGNISPLTNLAETSGVEQNIVAKNLSDIDARYRGSTSPFTGTTGVNLTFNTEASRTAAKQAFGNETVFIPGTSGIPESGRIDIKVGGRKTDYASEYERSLETMLRVAKDPHADIERITAAMAGFKGQVGGGVVNTRHNLVYGKIPGSAQAVAQSLNKALFSPGRFEQLMRTAKADKGMSVFMSDVIFFKSVAGLADDLSSSSAEYQELIDKTRIWLFESSRKTGAGVHGMFTRFPTLGEGHVRFWNARRAGTMRDQEALLDVINQSDIRKYMIKKGFHKNGQVTETQMNRFARSAKRAEKQEFSSMLVKEAANFSGSGSVYMPQIDGTIDIVEDGVKKSVQHSFSSAAQSYADTDGDKINFIMGQGSTTRKFVSRAMSSGAASKAFMVGEAEWIALQQHISAVQKGQVGGGSIDDLSPERVMNTQMVTEIRGKAVGPYSVALDRLRLGLGAYSRNDTLQRQGMAALSILEELLIKASKKGGGASDIAQRFAMAMGIGKGATIDAQAARGIIEQFALGKSYKASLKVDVPDFMGTHTSDIDTEKILDEIFSSFEELRSGGGLNADNQRRLKRLLETRPEDPLVDKLFREMTEGKGSFGGGLLDALSGGSATASRREGVDLAADAGKSLRNILSNKRMAIPVTIGTGAGLLALGFAGAGYSPKPLAPPGESTNAAVSSSIASGSILSGISNAVDGSPLTMRPGGEYPYVSRNSITNNQTYVEDDSVGSRVNMTIDGISNIPQAKQIIGSMGLSSNHLYMQDNRKPITKNFIDQMRED